MPNYTKCPSQVDHAKDEGLTTHGTKENPLPVPDTREHRYVESEYEEMGRIIGYHHLCAHQLMKYDGRVVDRNVAREANGTHHVFYFEVTVPWNAALAKKNAFVEGLKKNRFRLNPRERELLEAVEAAEKAPPAP